MQHLVGEEEELYQLIFSEISEVFLITNKTNLLLFISKNIDYIFGYTQSEIQEIFETISELLGDNLLQNQDL